MRFDLRSFDAANRTFGKSGILQAISIRLGYWIWCRMSKIYLYPVDGLISESRAANADHVGVGGCLKRIPKRVGDRKSRRWRALVWREYCGRAIEGIDWNTTKR